MRATGSEPRSWRLLGLTMLLTSKLLPICPTTSRLLRFASFWSCRSRPASWSSQCSERSPNGLWLIHPDMSLLAVSVQYYCDAEIVDRIPARRIPASTQGGIGNQSACSGAATLCVLKCRPSDFFKVGSRRLLPTEKAAAKLPRAWNGNVSRAGNRVAPGGWSRARTPCGDAYVGGMGAPVRGGGIGGSRRALLTA